VGIAVAGIPEPPIKNTTGGPGDAAVVGMRSPVIVMRRASLGRRSGTETRRTLASSVRPSNERIVVASC
jgi:hypothetical protein